MKYFECVAATLQEIRNKNAGVLLNVEETKAMDIAIEKLKQISPLKPIVINVYGQCPKCTKNITEKDSGEECKWCKQALEWPLLTAR